MTAATIDTRRYAGMIASVMRGNVLNLNNSAVIAPDIMQSFVGNSTRMLPYNWVSNGFCNEGIAKMVADLYLQGNGFAGEEPACFVNGGAVCT